MRRMLGVFGIVTATVLGVSTLIAAAQVPGHTVTITVVGIDRGGARVAVQSTVVPLRGNAVPSSGPTYTLAPGDSSVETIYRAYRIR